MGTFLAEVCTLLTMGYFVSVAFIGAGLTYLGAKCADFI